MDIVQVLGRLRPDSMWRLETELNPESSIDDVIWEDEDTEKPTADEVDECWSTLGPEIDRNFTKEARMAAYAKTSDPVYFQWKRGQATEQDWLDSVAEVQEAHPYPDEIQP